MTRTTLSIACALVSCTIYPNAAHAFQRQFSGMASYYWQPQTLASGGRFRPNGLSAAHRTLPFGTRIHVFAPHSGRSVIVTVNDRGPYIRNRVLDLSLGAARALNMTNRGVARIRARVM